MYMDDRYEIHDTTQEEAIRVETEQLIDRIMPYVFYFLSISLVALLCYLYILNPRHV